MVNWLQQVVQSERRSSQSLAIRPPTGHCGNALPVNAVFRWGSQVGEKSAEEPLVEKVLAAYKSSRLSGWQEDFLSRLVSESNHPFDISDCVVPRLEHATFGNSVALTHTHIHTHPGNSRDSRLFCSQDVAEKQGMFLIRFRATTEKKEEFPPSLLPHFHFLIPLHHFKRNMGKLWLCLILLGGNTGEGFQVDQLHPLLVNNCQLAGGCFKAPAF